MDVRRFGMVAGGMLVAGGTLQYMRVSWDYQQKNSEVTSIVQKINDIETQNKKQMKDIQERYVQLDKESADLNNHRQKLKQIEEELDKTRKQVGTLEHSKTKQESILASITSKIVEQRKVISDIQKHILQNDENITMAKRSLHHAQLEADAAKLNLNPLRAFGIQK